eukprot:1446847-Rhodomonas_salina.3
MTCPHPRSSPRPPPLPRPTPRHLPDSHAGCLSGPPHPAASPPPVWITMAHVSPGHRTAHVSDNAGACYPTCSSFSAACLSSLSSRSPAFDNHSISP